MDKTIDEADTKTNKGHDDEKEDERIRGNSTDEGRYPGHRRSDDRRYITKERRDSDSFSLQKHTFLNLDL